MDECLPPECLQWLSDGPDGQNGVTSPLWDVALFSEQAQQQVHSVLRPAVNPGAPQPAGDMLL